MARKLPWAPNPSSTSTNAVPSTRPPARKRRKISPSTDQSFLCPSKEEEEGTEIQTNDARPTSRRRDRSGRTPSTSPPPAPPAVQFMHEGLAADDGYMLVEDELYDTAKTFTAHLHHAEYKRLMKEAQERKRQYVAVNGHEQGQTADEIRRRKVTKILLQSDNATTRKEEEEDEVGKAEKRVGDPWAGTTLAGLMRFEPGRDRLSLRGLHGLHSTSRAAMGLGPNISGNGNTDARQSREPDAEPSHRRQRVAELPEVIRKEVRVPRSAQDDSSRTRSTTTTAIHNSRSIPRAAQDTGSSKNKLIVEREPNRLVKVEKTSKITTNKDNMNRGVRRFIDDLDDFDESLFAKNKEMIGAQARSTNASSSKLGTTFGTKIKASPGAVPRIKKEKDGNNDDDPARQRRQMLDRLDEVPVFLA